MDHDRYSGSEIEPAASGPASGSGSPGAGMEPGPRAGEQAAGSPPAIVGADNVAAAPEPLPQPVPQPAPQPAGDAGAPETNAAPQLLGHSETWWETLRSLIVVLIAVISIRTFVAEATVIPTGSMENTILIGDHVFLNKLLYGPEIPYTSWRLPVLRQIHRGDIVAFHYPVNPQQMFVKRVIAMGGDVLKIENKQVYVNGVALHEPYAQFVPDANMSLIVNFPPSLDEIPTVPAWEGLDPKWAHEMPRFIKPDGLHIPQGYFFAMGDNRDNSDDSRFWGFVPMQNVVGEPLFVYWSYDAPTGDWVADSLTARLRFDASIVKNFLKKTRWSRTGKAF